MALRINKDTHFVDATMVDGTCNFVLFQGTVIEAGAWRDESNLKDFRVRRSKKMTKKAETDYTVKVNGMPNYANIPKAVLEPIAKKFLEHILKEQQKKET